MIKFSTSPSFSQAGTIFLITKSQITQKKFPKNIPDQLKSNILDVVASGQFSGDRCEMFPVLNGDQVVLLVGVGNPRDLSMTKLRIGIKMAVQSKYFRKISDIELIPSDDKEEFIRGIVEGIKIGAYQWQKYLSNTKDELKNEDKVYTIIAPKKRAHENAVAICDGVNLTRDLVNENADVKTSTYIEKVVKKLIKGKKNISVEILGKKEMKSKGLHLHLAVNQGSKQEPRLLIVKYSGGAKKAGYTALIGKGITFDTGGLNLKPTGHIESMKMDMGGAGCVIGTLKNTINLNLKKNVLFVCGLAENVTGSAAYKPGDVLNSYSGKTVEVANTDAEGRLVLADAISYVVRNYKPARIVDIATLTGACIVALGYDHSGLVSTDDRMARKLIESSKVTDDRVWRLPSYPELKDSVKSQIADIRNLGSPKGAGGAITAAEFLRQFTEGTTWAHLDIAGTSYVENGKRQYYSHGGTGAGVRLLTHFLQNS